MRQLMFPIASNVSFSFLIAAYHIVKSEFTVEHPSTGLH
jgi:hypothetical protein